MIGPPREYELRQGWYLDFTCTGSGHHWLPDEKCRGCGEVVYRYIPIDGFARLVTIRPYIIDGPP